MITKTASNREGFARPYRLFANARTAFKAVLAALNFQPNEFVLLPAYIGWSAREGSGVFDPVAELALPYQFYRLDARLRIDLDHLERCFQTKQVKALLLIHYFGYVDPGYPAAVALARKYGAWVVEDEAHALLTDWVGGACGRLGDASIFSLHKMLPTVGGMLAVPAHHANLLAQHASVARDVPPPWRYDFFEIARRRRHNAQCLARLLAPLGDEIALLRESPAVGEVPQTLPVLVRRATRDALYFALNEAGFGAVSLYHTLISPIREDAFPDSHRLARSILNLPVHQDVSATDLAAMVERLKILLRSREGPLRRDRGPCCPSMRSALTRSGTVGTPP